MATPAQAVTSTDESEQPQAAQPQDILHRIAREDAPSSTPVEMKSLPSDNTIGNSSEQHDTHKSIDSSTEVRHQPMRTDTTTALQHAQHNDSSPPPPLPALPKSPELDRTVSTAIGPSSDVAPAPVPKDGTPVGPTLMLNLLLLTGARHPFNLDTAYLAKRNVQAQGNDPFNLSVYKVKELILREWRSEWESKPSSPSAIRLIHLGKVLDDKTAFKGTFVASDHDQVC